MNTISFHDTQFNIVPHNGQPWLTAPQIAQALGYANEDAVSRIYRRNADEFTNGMTLTVKLTFNGINNSLREKEVRIFSLRGAHLIAMFSRTALAKEFRRWVLDILDKEMGSVQGIAVNDDELHSLAWLWRAADNMMDAAKSIYPLLRVAEHKEAARYYSIIHEYAFTLQQAKNILADKTLQVQPSSLERRDWERLIPHLQRH